MANLGFLNENQLENLLNTGDPGGGDTPGLIAWGAIGGLLADQPDLVAALAAKLDDSQASAYGLTLLAAANAAAAKTLLALVKADVGLGSVDNTADAAKSVLTATKLFTARNFTITGDGAWTVSFDGSANVSAALSLTTVNANVGTFGGASKSLTATANAKGLITAIAEQNIAITASQVTDFSEAADDRIATLIQNGTGITWSYNDGVGTLTPTVTITQYTDEAAQDAVGAMIDGTLVYVDATPLLSRAAIAGDITIAQGSNTAAITAGVIVDADVNAAAGIAHSKMAALTASRLLVSDGSGFVTVSAVTATEAGYLSGVTSAIQTQLSGKVTSVTVNTANGVSASNTGTATAPAFTFTLGAITPSSVLSSGSIYVVADMSSAVLSARDTQAPATGSTTGGKILASIDGKPTAANQRIGAFIFGAKDSGGTEQITAGLFGRSGENWGTLAGQGTYLSIEVTANAAFSRTQVGTITSTALTLTIPVVATNIDASGNTTGNAATATKLATARTIGISGDATWSSGSFDGSSNVTAAITFATVNANVGSFGSATQVGTFTVNAKGLITAASNITVTPAVGSITGLGTGVATALAVNTGSAGAVVLFNGALGTPSSGTLTNCTGLPIAGLTSSTSTALGVGSIELGNVSDCTISRAAAGDVNIEGNRVYRAGGTDVAVADGGTGFSSYAVGDLLYASASGTLSKLAAVATGNVLISGGVTTAPSWGQVGLTTHVTGVLGSANGGTGNGFTKFSGPATAEKTFTLPNASDTIVCYGVAGTFTGGQQFSGGARVTGSGGAWGSTGSGIEFVGGGTNTIQAYNRTAGAYLPLAIVGSTLKLQVNGGLPGNYANDAAAAVGGVAVGELYRNGSVLMVRVT